LPFGGLVKKITEEANWAFLPYEEVWNRNNRMFKYNQNKQMRIWTTNIRRIITNGTQ
jgi:hypothetical protein